MTPCSIRFSQICAFLPDSSFRLETKQIAVVLRKRTQLSSCSYRDVVSHPVQNGNGINRKIRWSGRVWCGKGSNETLSAGAGVHCHVRVDLQDHVLVLIEKKDTEWGHLLRDTAGLWNARDNPDRSDDALDGGVVRRFQGLWNQETFRYRNIPGHVAVSG